MKKLLIAAIIAIPTLAVADMPADAIKARQGYFRMLGIDMGTLAGMAKGEIAYDEAMAAKAAANVEALSNYDVSALFPEGSSSDDVEGTDALPDIWSDSEGFTQKYAALKEAAMGASEAVKGGQDKVGPVLQKLGGTCKGCHDDFRKD